MKLKCDIFDDNLYFDVARNKYNTNVCRAVKMILQSPRIM